MKNINIDQFGGGGNTVKIPAAEIKSTPFANVRFAFVNITPELAADWLKANRKNRSLREWGVNSLILDIQNDSWMTTHQGIAFDADGNLIDGQHRLLAIVRAGKPVLAVVSTGWPAEVGRKNGANRRTMDAVDRGRARTLADQLHLQHDIPKQQAGEVVKLCNSLAAACLGLDRVRVSTPETILATFALYKAELQWWLDNRITQQGLRSIPVAVCLIMARSVWGDKAQDARERIRTGENLSRENPLLHLRNWLMGSAANEPASTVRNAAFHHLAAFVDGKSLPNIIVHSAVAHGRVLKLHKVRVEKICRIYGYDLPEVLRAPAEAPTPSAKAANALSPEAIKVGESLSPVFTSTDLVARTDGQAGQWLLIWVSRKWIESAGVNQYRKTASFGKV